MNESVRLKVLMVHGYRQNGNSFREKTGAFRKVLKKYIEPVFITAPMVLPENEAESAWWFSDEDRFSSREVSATCRGFDRSVEAVREAVRTHGHIDGVMGFSQGAALVALLCALQQRGDENFGFNFAILIAGFRSRSSPHQYLYAEPIILPSLHVIGAGDQVISADMSGELVGGFVDATVVPHAGGHYVPVNSTLKEHYSKFLLKFTSADSVTGMSSDG